MLQVCIAISKVELGINTLSPRSSSGVASGRPSHVYLTVVCMEGTVLNRILHRGVSSQVSVANTIGQYCLVYSIRLYKHRVYGLFDKPPLFVNSHWCNEFRRSISQHQEVQMLCHTATKCTRQECATVVGQVSGFPVPIKRSFSFNVTCACNVCICNPFYFGFYLGSILSKHNKARPEYNSLTIIIFGFTKMPCKKS